MLTCAIPNDVTTRYPGLEQMASLEDIVLVVPNYRLGSFGFMTLPVLDRTDPRNVSGNYGLLDQQLALAWVQENIRSFGGDSNNVTVLGQSSGGTSILALLASPGSKALFHAAVSLSASPNITVSITDAQKIFAAAVAAANTTCSGDGDRDHNHTFTAACLRALPARTVASLLPSTFDVSPGLPTSPRGMNYPGQ